MTDMSYGYSVYSRDDCGKKTSYYVIVTNSSGVEYIVTRFTHDKAQAERWCRDLRRAAQVEEDRKQQARAGR